MVSDARDLTIAHVPDCAVGGLDPRDAQAHLFDSPANIAKVDVVELKPMEQRMVVVKSDEMEQALARGVFRRAELRRRGAEPVL